ncbi:hypothetical protein CSC74_08225 [Pseudoxanthomonas yeongjuensis]|uniref:lasso peptide biosynthesis B2 protein n=1 Tax=Pseudoxanthomonas yeongjuensis TaxID=377616 RepID=UPI0013915D9D|nr:lasso peptide biosynthesis B2 protein [Pseudoxanthomonas yeongjuensis]KAF1716852.1 hypothetical protein CSC74_08225 [Pseudoxanthomonas yeongjuensis]
MSYQLRKGLSCCEVDGHVIFLDVAQDRYFRLSNTAEPIFRSFLAHEDVSAEQFRKLVDDGILVEATSGERGDAPIPFIQPPARSALEQSAATANRRLGVMIFLEVLAIVWSTQRQLSSRAFKTIIEHTASQRCCRTDVQGADAGGSAPSEDNLVGAATEFSRARRYVPIEPSCLLDSLSLVRFLSRRRLSANIVIGVTLNPFAAHCWVQVGELVLNETLSDANAHTLIRVI